jgi:hypothetical protein
VAFIVISPCAVILALVAYECQVGKWFDRIRKQACKTGVLIETMVRSSLKGCAKTTRTPAQMLAKDFDWPYHPVSMLDKA